MTQSELWDNLNKSICNAKEYVSDTDLPKVWIDRGDFDMFIEQYEKEKKKEKIK